MMVLTGAVSGTCLCDAALRRTCDCQSCSRRSYNWQLRLSDQIESMASHWYSCESITVSDLFPSLLLLCWLNPFHVNSRLLDAQLQQCIEDGAVLNAGENDLVVKSMLALLTNDGLSSSH